MDVILGIDTSNYTTSVSAVTAHDGRLIGEARKLLPVKSGERGLRQSDALFHHVSRLPLMMDVLMSEIRDQLLEQEVRWSAVGVSVRPRPQCSSYMPVFMAGRSFAESFGRALGIPVVHTSHQEGHIAAAEYFLDIPQGVPFIAVHISGGTSDVLVARRTRFGYCVESVGEGADLHAGQFVDRVGVALGLPFPSGPALELLAKRAKPDSALRFHSSVKGAQMSFSGPCSAALRSIEQGYPAEEIALAVQACVAANVTKAVREAKKRYPHVGHCVIAGGVASNEYIKHRIVHRLKIEDRGLHVHFAPARYSSDNALGPAAIAYRHYQSAVNSEHSV